MADHFQVHETNPNDTIGGGGCLATGGNAGEDCSGRWVNFFRVSTEFDASPYAVICEYHLAETVAQLAFEESQAPGDILPQRIVNEPHLPPFGATPHVVIR
jgi:hypothetical protein